MSDFSRQSHDFRGFISSLTKDFLDEEDKKSAEEGREEENKASPHPALIKHIGDWGKKNKKKLNPQEAAHDGKASMARAKAPPEQNVGSASVGKILQPVDKEPVESDAIQFENILFYVCLPDLNYFKDPPHAEIRRLFRWLTHRGVEVIRHLSIPDSTTLPMDDVLVREDVTERFTINKIEWRKLDINLEVLTKSKSPDHLTSLTLYSSGNWSVLYHWISDDGLKNLHGVRVVQFLWGVLATSEHKTDCGCSWKR